MSIFNKKEKTIDDLEALEKIEYLQIQEKLKKLSVRMDSGKFKNSLEEKQSVIGEYLELSKRENELIPHSKKRKFKDSAIKEVFDYGVSALELKQKSRAKYERLKQKFNAQLTKMLSKVKKNGKEKTEKA